MAIKIKMTDPQKAVEYFDNKVSFTTGPMELNDLIEKHAELNVIDVRNAEDYNEEHIPGALNLPQDKWNTFQGLRKEVINVVYCYNITCHLASFAALHFAKQGFPVMELEGGFDHWKKNDLKVESGQKAA